MSYNYTLKYRTFNQLLEEINVDFRNYNLQNSIEPQTLIKVARRITYDLGLRVYKTKEAVLEIEKGKVKLPDDFFVLNYALICGQYTVETILPQGTHIEERKIVPRYQSTPAHTDVCAPETVNCTKCNPNPCSCQESCCETSPCDGLEYNPLEPYGNYCNTPRVFMNCKNECYELVQILKTETRVYKQLYRIKIINNPQTIDCDCPNLYWNTPFNAWIKDGYLYSTLECAKIYINYQGMPEDDEGNLLVPDHDLLNEYYEYGLKQRILENLIMNDEPQAAAKLQLIEQRYRAARNNALSFVNTPNFAEMKQVWEMNRKAMYAKYYDMFKSYRFEPYFGDAGMSATRVI